MLLSVPVFFCHEVTTALLETFGQPGHVWQSMGQALRQAVCRMRHGNGACGIDARHRGCQTFHRTGMTTAEPQQYLTLGIQQVQTADHIAACGAHPPCQGKGRAACLEERTALEPVGQARCRAVFQPLFDEREEQLQATVQQWRRHEHIVFPRLWLFLCRGKAGQYAVFSAPASDDRPEHRAIAHVCLLGQPVKLVRLHGCAEGLWLQNEGIGLRPWHVSSDSAASGVQGPGFVTHMGPCQDTHFIVRSLHHGLQFDRLACLQDDGPQDSRMQHLHRAISACGTLGSSQRHFQKSGSRVIDALPHPVVSYPGAAFQIQHVFPLLRTGRAPAQQGMVSRVFDQPCTFRCGGGLAVFTLPGIGRQSDMLCRQWKMPFHIHRPAVRPGSAPGMVELPQAVPLAGQRAAHPAFQRAEALFCLAQAAAQIAQKDVVRADLHKKAYAHIQCALGSAMKIHWFTHIAPPVGSTAGHGMLPARDRGDKGLLRQTAPQFGKGLQELFPHAVHTAAVEGVFQGQHFEKDTPLLQVFSQLQQACTITAQGHGIGSIDACQFNAVIVFQQSSDLVRPHAHSRHFAQAPGLALTATAVMDDSDSLFQRQCAAVPGSRHLAYAVAIGHVSAYAHSFQGSAQPGLHQKKQLLGRFCAFHLCRRDVLQLCQHVFTAEGLHEGSHLAGLCGKGGIAHERPAHACPLAAIAGKDKGCQRPCRAYGLAIAKIPCFAFCCKGSQALCLCRGRCPFHHQPVRQGITAQHGLSSHVIKLFCLIFDRFGVPAGQGAQAGLTAGREEERRHYWHRPAAALYRRGGLQQEMPIGPAKAEGIDPGQRQAPCARQARHLQGHTQVEALEVDGRIELADMYLRRHAFFTQYQQGLHDACHGRGCFQMAQMAFDRTDEQGRSPVLPQGMTDGSGLHRVTGSRACAVGLQIGQSIRLITGSPVYFAQQCLLRVGTGQGYALCASVTVAGYAAYDRMDMPPLCQCRIQRLQEQHPAALGPHIAVTRGIEDLAAPVRREHMRL